MCTTGNAFLSIDTWTGRTLFDEHRSRHHINQHNPPRRYRRLSGHSSSSHSLCTHTRSQQCPPTHSLTYSSYTPPPLLLLFKSSPHSLHACVTLFYVNRRHCAHAFDLPSTSSGGYLEQLARGLAGKSPQQYTHSATYCPC